MTVAHIVETYLRGLRLRVSAKTGRPFSARTIEGYGQQLRPWATACGDTALGDVTHEHLTAHLAALRADGYTDWSVATREKVIRVFLAWCIDEGLIATHPAARLRRTVARDTPVLALTDAEVDRLLGGCDRRTWTGLRDRALLLTLLETGLRCSEAAALDYSDYNQDQQERTVRHGKGDKPRVVGVPEGAALALLQWVTYRRGSASGPLFWSDRGGRLTRSGIYQLVERAGARANVAHCHPHRLRHQFAVSYLRAGGDLETLRRILGHSTLAMAARYVRALEQEHVTARHRQVMGNVAQGKRSR